MKQECWSKQSGFKITSIENLLIRIHFTTDSGSSENQFMISDALFDAKFAGTLADIWNPISTAAAKFSVRLFLV